MHSSTGNVRRGRDIRTPLVDASRSVNGGILGSLRLRTAGALFEHRICIVQKNTKGGHAQRRGLGYAK